MAIHFHEILKTFYTLGCEDEALCYGACRVYIYLKEEKHMHDVQYMYEKQLQLFYLTARKEPDALTDLFVPALTTDAFNLVQLKRCREVITLPDGGKPESIVLAICDPSSTVLLYRMTPGLKEIGQKLPSKGKLLRMKTVTDCEQAL
uniref:tRNA-splicing endonuclease subunit Sen15 domain-containing protein n=1 Tax=Anopheles christyi TaxID=43041 RepID=A0A182KGG4_9DIPT